MWTIRSLTLTDHHHPVFSSDLIAQCVLYAVRYTGLHLDWKGIWLCTRTVFFMRIQSTLLRLWLLCVMSVIVLVNQLPAFRATWGHMRGYLMRNMKLEMAIICGDAAIIMYICRMKWTESDRMYVEKVKQKKNMFDGLFICQHVLTSIFFLMQKCFIKIILPWEIFMMDEFWFNQKSSSGLVDLDMWKNGLILVDMFKLCHVMQWNFFFFWK